MTQDLRISVFYDVPDWAFHNVARNVARSVENCKVGIYGRAEWFGQPDVVDRIVRDNDLLVFLWRFDVLAFLDNIGERAWARLLGPDRPALATVVYDHLYQDRAEIEAMGDPFEVSDIVACCSGTLRRHYDAAPDLPRIDAILPDGVDLHHFTSQPRVRDDSRPLRIGWVGNSAWGNTVAIDLKGRRSVFEPAMARLKALGHPVETRIADAAEKRLPHRDMPAFYRDIDILVCSSAMEGTPNPVLEAMACGAAVVSTDVGIVRDVLGPKQSRFILDQRSPEALSAALELLLRDRQLLADLKAENLSRRRHLAWQTRAPLWNDFFDDALASRERDRGRACSAALREYRFKTRSGIARARRLVATNRIAFYTYETLRAHFPGVIRYGKRLISRGMI